MDTLQPPAGWRDDGPNAWGTNAWRRLHAAPPSRYGESSRWANDSCTPTRHRSLTAQPQAQTKPVVYAQYDPAFDDDLHPQPVPAAKPVPARVEPELAPIAVPNWPTRQTVEPEPVPVVVNRTAARFGALELR